MYRIKENCEHTIEIEKSKFITYLMRVFKEEEAKEYITRIQKLHPNANHHCYAFLIGENSEIQRSNDNGEPSGTAGVPMLESLRKNNMQDTLAITVRYFGGIKLGAGGLIRAYSKSVSQALQNATLTQTLATKQYTLAFSYDFIGRLDYFFQEKQIEVLEKIYEEDVCYRYRTTLSIEEEIAEITSGKYFPQLVCEEVVEVSVKQAKEE